MPGNGNTTSDAVYSCMARQHRHSILVLSKVTTAGMLERHGETHASGNHIRGGAIPRVRLHEEGKAKSSWWQSCLTKGFIVAGAPVGCCGIYAAVILG